MGYYNIKYNSTRKYAMLRDSASGNRVYAPYFRTGKRAIRFTKRFFTRAAEAITYRSRVLERVDRWGVNLREL